MFNSGVAQRLTATQQQLHYMAITLTVIAVALIMTPAAYHRQTSPYAVTESFIRLSTRLLLWSMLPLAIAIAIAIDFYLVGTLLAGERVAVAGTGGVLGITLVLWFGLPRLASGQVGVPRDVSSSSGRPGLLHG